MLFQSWKDRARRIRLEIQALSLACRDPRTPWHAKLTVACVVAYGLSPIDLIPDFIPVLGYLDDLVLLPLGIALALKMIPPQVLQECRQRAMDSPEGQPRHNWTAAIVIVSLWGVLLLLLARGLWHW